MMASNVKNAMTYVLMNNYKVESNKVLEKEMIFKTGGIDFSNGIPIGLMDKEIGYYVLSQSNDLKENIKRLNFLGKEFVNKEILNLEILDNVPNSKEPLVPS